MYWYVFGTLWEWSCFFFVEKGREYPLPIKIIFSGCSRECGPKRQKKIPISGLEPESHA